MSKYRVRPLEPRDYPSLLRILRDITADSRYAEFGYDEAGVSLMLDTLHAQGYAAILVDENDVAVGGIGGFVYPMYFNGKLQANDVAFFIEPVHRTFHNAVALIRAWTAWATSKGAIYVEVHVTSGVADERIGKLLKRLGYGNAGLAFAKRV